MYGDKGGSRNEKGTKHLITLGEGLEKRKNYSIYYKPNSLKRTYASPIFLFIFPFPLVMCQLVL
jgi:hypothetical protein